MPSPPVEEIPINDTLKELGVTKFHKLDSIFQIFLDENCLLTVDIGKESSKTLKNLLDAAEDGGLEKSKIDNLKLIVARDYPELLKLVEVKERTESKSNDKQKEQSSAVNAVRIAQWFCEEFFTDNLGQPHAATKIGNHIEVIPIKTEKFKDWLTKQCFDVGVAETKKRNQMKDGGNIEDSDVLPNEDILSSEALTRALRYLRAQAVYSEKPRKELYLRVAKIGDTIYYDLTNSEWQVVKITSEGWSVVYSPVLFRRYSHQLPQVMPEPVNAVGSVDIFDDFLKLLNISEDEDNKVLFKCYIISLFYYGIVHAALMLHGEAGAARLLNKK